MNKPLAHRPAPPLQASQVLNELRADRERAKSAPWAAACWLSFLALIGPFIPVVGMATAAAGAEIFAVIMLVLAIVLFVRGAVMRGVVTVLFASLLTLWISGGALAALLFTQQAFGFQLPWPVLPK